MLVKSVKRASTFERAGSLEISTIRFAEKKRRIRGFHATEREGGGGGFVSFARIIIFFFFFFFLGNAQIQRIYS